MNGTSLFCLILGAAAVSAGVGCSDSGSTGTTGGASNGGSAATSGGNTTTNGGTSMGGTSSGGASMGGAASGGRPAEIPPTESQADITAFVKSGAYKNPPWVSETTAPRMGTIGSQHLSKVRVYENPTLVNALKAGHDGLNGHPFPDQWSMAVKEIYDDAGANHLGTAVALKNQASDLSSAWIYYCTGPDNRCVSTTLNPSEAMPIYGNGMSTSASECGFCHAGMIFTVIK